jgi:peptide/nickel transport system permease protein
VIGLGIVAALALISLAAPLVAPHDPLATAAGQQFQAPSLGHPFGTDELGRDILSRTIHGGRTSLLIAGVAVAIASLIGFPLGLLAGYFSGGVVNSVFMRLTDMLLAFPPILLAMVVVAILGPGARSVILSIAIVSIPPLARLARAAMLAQKNADYVTATRTVGASDPHIIFRAVLPNCLPPILVQLALAAGTAILLEAALSFLGLGTQPPTPSWGSMLYSARSYLSQSPWYGIFPGIFITLLILALDALSMGLRDVLDPSTRR